MLKFQKKNDQKFLSKRKLDAELLLATNLSRSEDTWKKLWFPQVNINIDADNDDTELQL